MLYPDQAANFRTEFYRYLVRLGVIADGSCFIHTLLLATNEQYDDFTINERKNLALETRQKIAECVDMEAFEAISNGNLANSLYNESFLKFFQGLRKRFQGETHGYSVVLSAVPIEAINKALTDSATPEESVVRIVRLICNILGGNSYENAANELIGKLSTKARKSSYDNFIKRLKDPSEFIDEALFTAIASHVNRDIYIFDSETREPYRGLMVNETQNDLSLFVVYDSEEAHYELMGVVDHNGDYSVQFTADHPLVVKTRSALGYESVGMLHEASHSPAPLHSPRSAESVIQVPTESADCTPQQTASFASRA